MAEDKINSKEQEKEQMEPAAEELREQPQEAGDEQLAEQPVDRVQELEEKVASLNERYLRVCADFENFRKRSAKEKTDLLLSASKDTIKAILPVIDDLERALAATGDDEGVRLIYSKLMKILEQKGLKAMEMENAKFDMALHEAVAQVPASDAKQKGMVVDVVEKGYFLNDNVLRYAKVVVAC